MGREKKGEVEGGRRKMRTGRGGGRREVRLIRLVFRAVGGFMDVTFWASC